MINTRGDLIAGSHDTVKLKEKYFFIPISNVPI